MKKIVIGSLCVVMSLFAESIYATFDVVAKKSANVAFSSGGTVDIISVDIGSSVKKGEKLAVLNNNDIKALLNIRQTSLKYAKKDYDRQVKIKNIIDRAKFDKYENLYESAKAQVIYQQAILDKTILKAPFDGIVVSKEIESGDVVSGQQIKTAFKIQSIHKRKLILQFDQKYHSVVKVGDHYSYKVDGDEKLYVSKISKVYPSISMNNRKLKAEVEVEGFVVGLFGDGYILTPDDK